MKRRNGVDYREPGLGPYEDFFFFSKNARQEFMSLWVIIRATRWIMRVRNVDGEH